MRHDDLYEASALVFLSRVAIAAGATGQNPSSYQDPVRLAATQAELSEVDSVTTALLRATGSPVTRQQFLNSARVVPAPGADFLKYMVKNGDPDVAVLLANTWARTATTYVRRLNSQSLASALAVTRRHLEDLRATKNTDSDVFRSLVDKAEQLETMRALQPGASFVFAPAKRAPKISPQPVKAGALGLILGAVLGLLFAVLAEALDRRARSDADIAAALGTHLLGRVGGVAGADAVATAIELMLRDRSGRIVVLGGVTDRTPTVDSADAIAAATAAAGSAAVAVHVASDGAEASATLADVSLGRVSVDDALVSLPTRAGSFRILHSGTSAAPFAFGPRLLAECAEAIGDSASFVVVAAPPFGDGRTTTELAAAADGVVVVAEARVRRDRLEELRDIVAATPARLLGVVVVDTNDPPERLGPAAGFAPREAAER